MTVDATSGLVKCTVGGDPCNYKFNSGTANPVTCQCGFSADGQAYCPLRYDETIDAWKSYIAAQQAYTVNSCHTMRRSGCTEDLSASKVSNMKSSLYQTVFANTFYNAPGCVKTIFGDSNRIRLGVFSAIAMIFAWFML